MSSRDAVWRLKPWLLHCLSYGRRREEYRGHVKARLLIGSQTPITSATLEHCSEPAQFEQVSDPGLQIRELQFTASPARGYKGADQRTDARAVDVADLRQIQHNAAGSGDEPANCALQKIRRCRRDSARAADYGSLSFLLRTELQFAGGTNWVRCHCTPPVLPSEGNPCVSIFDERHPSIARSLQLTPRSIAKYSRPRRDVQRGSRGQSALRRPPNRKHAPFRQTAGRTASPDILPQRSSRRWLEPWTCDWPENEAAPQSNAG